MDVSVIAHRSMQVRNTITLLWRRRNSCDTHLRTIARDLLRSDVQALRRLSRNTP